MAITAYQEQKQHAGQQKRAGSRNLAVNSPEDSSLSHSPAAITRQQCSVNSEECCGHSEFRNSLSGHVWESVTTALDQRLFSDMPSLQPDFIGVSVPCPLIDDSFPFLSSQSSCSPDAHVPPIKTKTTFTVTSK